MKKAKIDSAKLQLHKKKIMSLSDESMAQAQGGRGMDNTDGNNYSFHCSKITQGRCDVPTIGHDDGPNCLSASDWGWCWCRGI